MLRFNTSFLLKATVVTSLCCLPIALDKESGFVWTAFLLPVSLAWLASSLVGRQEELGFKSTSCRTRWLKSTPRVVGKINGLTRLRIILAGGCLSLVTGFPMLHLVDPEPPEFWVPFVVLIAVCGVMLGGYSARRRVLTDERRFVTGYLLFGRLCWWRRRWRPQDCGPNEFVYWHALFVCRSRRRQLIASMYTNDRDAPDMEIAADRVAKLVDLPYEGYRESKVLWWAS